MSELLKDGMTHFRHRCGLERFTRNGCLSRVVVLRVALATSHNDVAVEDQLNGWWRDRTTWPMPRSFETFTGSFNCQFHTTLVDLADEPLIEEYI